MINHLSQIDYIINSFYWGVEGGYIMNKIRISLEELNVLSKVFPKMTIQEFIKLKKQA